ncbi:divalent metal cation transporter [Patescibacteria group bacterium]|nr:divalent metal cation transporter [Patescibacteria group bacterium]
MKTWPKPKLISGRRRHYIRDFFVSKKEGVIAGGADNDPAGMITYLQIGASTGYALLWLMVVSTPMLIVVEQMAAKIGIVLRLGLARVLKDYYGKRIALLLVTLVMLANIFTIGANIAGMADLTAITFDMESQYVLFVALIGLFILLFLLRGRYSGISKFLFILTPISLVYIITTFIVKPDWHSVALGMVGARMSFELNYWMLVVGAIGTIIAPYIVFWETTAEIEEKKTVKDLRETNIGIGWGMTFANIICMFIVILAAKALGGHGGAIENIRQASEVLRPLAGDAAFGLFSLGMLASGFVAIPVLISSTAYMIADLLGWRSGLNKEEYQAPAFYLLIIIAVSIGILMNVFNVNPVQAMIWSQVAAGCVAPFIVVALLLVCNNKKLMGAYTNSRAANVVGYLTVAIMTFSIGLFLFDIFK